MCSSIKRKKSEQTEEMMRPRSGTKTDKREDLEGLSSASFPVFHHLKTAHFLGSSKTESEVKFFLLT